MSAQRCFDPRSQVLWIGELQPTVFLCTKTNPPAARAWGSHFVYRYIYIYNILYYIILYYIILYYTICYIQYKRDLQALFLEWNVCKHYYSTFTCPIDNDCPEKVCSHVIPALSAPGNGTLARAREKRTGRWWTNVVRVFRSAEDRNAHRTQNWERPFS